MSEFIFKLPDLGEGTVESEIGEWFVKVGDRVAEEDIVGTMLTDKAAVELSAPVGGTVTRLAGEPGDMVAVGAPLVVFETDGEVAATETAPPAATPAAAAETPDPAPAAEATRETAKTPSQAGAEPGARVRVATSPAIRRRAREAGVDLTQVPGSGPGGRILRKDFDQFLKARATGSSFEALAAPSTRVREIKIIGLRRIIAERMAAAKREIPHFAYVEEVDITELEALRRHLNESRDAAARLTLLPFLAMALIRALKDFPQCNVTHDSNRNLLLQHEPVHLGVATQTPDGLKVPVVKHAEVLSLDGLSAEIRRLSEALPSATAMARKKPKASAKAPK